MTLILIKNTSYFRSRFQHSWGGSKFWERKKNNLKASVLLGFSKNFPFPVPNLRFQLQPLSHKGFPVPTIYYVYIGMFLGTHTYNLNVNNKTGGIQNLTLEVFA